MLRALAPDPQLHGRLGEREFELLVLQLSCVNFLAQFDLREDGTRRLAERWCGRLGPMPFKMALRLGLRGLGRGCGHSSAPYPPVAQPFGRPLQELLVHGHQTFELVAVPFCMLEDLIKFG